MNFEFSPRRDRSISKKGEVEILFVYFHFSIFGLISLSFSLINHLISNKKIHYENEFLSRRDGK